MSDKRYIINNYYNSNLIWRTVSPLVVEVIPLDHPSRVIRWYDLIHSIQYDAVRRSSYYNNNVYLSIKLQLLIDLKSEVHINIAI